MVVVKLEIERNYVEECLICKEELDTLYEEYDRKKKPPVVAEGKKNIETDSGESDTENISALILSDPPNLCKQIGDSMSKIPYYFDTPVPRYFRERGWFKNENTYKFVTWAFSKCNIQQHTTVFDNREITLEPYEFICGRNSSSAECFLTPKEFRGQLNLLVNQGILKKGANSRANRFSTFSWVIERFNEKEGQLKGQDRANSGPTPGHNLEDKKIRDKEKDHHPYIPSFDPKDEDGLIDDFFPKKEEEEKVHVHLSCYMKKQELQECVKDLGSLEKVKETIDQVLSWPDRKFEIKNWLNTIKTWKKNNPIPDRIAQNEKLAKEVQNYYTGCLGWNVRIYHDKIKDVRGLLFECTGVSGETNLIYFTDLNFQEKVKKFILLKKITKKI